MARPAHRSAHSEFLIFSSNTTLGWSATRRTSYRKGEALVSQGRWRRVTDETGAHVGYQPVECNVVPVPSQDASRAALGEAEMKANAGLMGASHTAHMSDEERGSRVHPKSGRLMPEMDFVEKVRTVVASYTHSANFHDMKKRGIHDRAVRVYPRVPEMAAAQ
jgi:hypothetical protein